MRQFPRSCRGRVVAFLFPRSLTSCKQPKMRLLESMAYEMPISQLLCFDIHTKCRGVGVLWRSLATTNAFEPCLSILAVRPVLGRKRASQSRATPSARFCRIYRKQGTRRFESICKREWVQPATSSHSPKRYPFGGVKCSTLEFIATYGSLWQRQLFLLSRAAPTPPPANPLPLPRKPIRQNLAQQQTKHRSRPRWSRCRKARRSARR